MSKVQVSGSKTMKKGSKQILGLTVTPATANSTKVSWKSSDKKIATVDKNGKVVAKKKGSVVITATAKDGNCLTAGLELFPPQILWREKFVDRKILWLI